MLNYETIRNQSRPVAGPRGHAVCAKRWSAWHPNYCEESFKPDDLRLIKEALPDSVEPILLRKEKEEVNPVLMFFQPGDRLVP